jgi:DNA-binding NtrC family response regulator
MRLLLAGVDPQFSPLLALTLQTWGHTVVEASIAKDAMAAASDQQLQVAICDLSALDPCGPVLMQALRGGFGMGGVAMTFRGDFLSPEGYGKAGFQDMLVKPMSPTDLLRGVREAFTQWQRTRDV